MNRGVLAGLGPGDGPDVASGDVGQNALLSAGIRKEVTFSTTTNQAVASTDCSNYRWVSVQFTTFGGGNAQFQCSNDNVTWVTQALTNVGTSANSVNASNTSLWAGPVQARYFRISVTGISGTIAGTAEFMAVPAPAVQQYVGFTVTPTVNVQSSYGIADAMSNGGTTWLGAVALVYNGATWDRPRTATKFASVEATASGDTAVATPTSGKKIRVLGYSIDVTQDASSGAGADVAIVLRDATTALGYGATVYCPAAAATTFGPGYSSGWRMVNNGVLSATANNVLNVNLSAALATGKCRVNVAYCEE